MPQAVRDALMGNKSATSYGVVVAKQQQRPSTTAKHEQEKSEWLYFW